MAEPFAQFGARRDLFEPKVNPGSRFRYASRPEPIDQHPETVVFFSRLVSSFEFDHPAIPYGGSLIISGALWLLLIPTVPPPMPTGPPTLQSVCQPIPRFMAYATTG